RGTRAGAGGAANAPHGPPARTGRRARDGAVLRPSRTPAAPAPRRSRGARPSWDGPCKSGDPLGALRHGTMRNRRVPGAVIGDAIDPDRAGLELGGAGSRVG